MQPNIQQSINRVQIPILNGLNTTFSMGNSIEDLDNLYLELDQNGRSGGYLTQFPGLRSVFSAGTGTRLKGLGQSIGTTQGNVLFAISGTSIFRLVMATGNRFSFSSSSQTASNFNTTGYVQIVNGPTDGQDFFLETFTGVAYVRNQVTGVLTQVTDPDFPSAAHTAAFIDGYFVVSRRGHPTFFISNLNDALSWTATDFATAESVGDDIVSIDSNETYLWLFGRSSIELWTNTGNADFPFEKVPNAVMRIGIVAPFAKTRVFGNFVILGRSDSGGSKVISFNGTDPGVLSTPAIESILKRIDYTKIANGYDAAQVANNNITLNSFENRGHTYLVLKVPASFDTQSVGFVLCYDFLTQKWFKVSGTNIGEDIVNLAGATYCISGTLDSVFIIDENEFTRNATSAGNDGTDVNKSLVTPYLHDLDNNVILNTLELTVDLEQSGDVPVVLSVSKDFGRTFSSGITKIASNAGRNRLRWHRLGKGRDLVFKFNISGVTKRFNIISLYADIGQTTH